MHTEAVHQYPPEEVAPQARLTLEEYTNLVGRYDKLSREILTASMAKAKVRVRCGEKEGVGAKEAYECYLDEKYAPMNALCAQAREVHKQLLVEEHERLTEARLLLAQGQETYWPDHTNPLSKQRVSVAKDSVVVYGKGGTIHPITGGDLAIAPMWKRHYRFAPGVPKEYAEQYIHACYEQVKNEHNDRLATLEVLSNSINDTSPTLNTYIDILHRSLYGETLPAESETALEKSKREKAEAGLMAEKIVKSFFIKLSTNNAWLGITLLSVPLTEDVEGQVDFVLHIENTKSRHTREVKTNAGDMQNIAVQFTTAQSVSVVAHKGMQLTRQRNLDTALNRNMYTARVLVILPMKNLLKIVKDWPKADQKIPGGAERLCTQNEQEGIFRGVLQQLPEGLIDIDSAWAQIREGSTNS